MPISDLTGTKWILNQNLSYSGVTRMSGCRINFTSNSMSFGGITNLIELSNYETDRPLYAKLQYSNNGTYTDVYTTYSDDNNNSWANQAYRIISITGGTDVTNANLIAWLQANATQVPVTDLSGTKWISKSTYSATATSSPMVYSINTIDNIGFATDSGSIFLYGAFLKDGSYIAAANRVCIGDRIYADSPGAWSINIVDGTDTTNPDLIAWLTQNATYQEPTPVYQPISSFGDLSVVDNTSWLTLTINGVSVDIALQPLMNFTIDSGLVNPIAGTKTYEAQQGMTWQQWVNSAYNTDGYIIYNTRVCTNSYTYCVINNNSYVYASDTIIANNTYGVVTIGGGD